MNTQFRRIFSLSILVIVLIAAGCSSIFAIDPEVIKGSGSVTTETRALDSFTRVDLRGQGDIVLTKGASPSIVVEAEDNFMVYLRSNVSSGTLILDTPDNVNLQLTQPIIFHLTYTDSPTELAISGSGSIHAEDLTTNSLDVRVSGTGDCVLSGTAPQLTFDLSGTGGFDGREFTSQNATVRISGTGTAIVNAAQTLDITVNGTGGVSYLGSPQITQNISGVGSVIALH